MAWPSPRLALLVALAAAATALAGTAGLSLRASALALALVVPIALDLWLLGRSHRAVVVWPPELRGSLRRPLTARLEIVGARVTSAALGWPAALGGPLTPARVDPRRFQSEIAWAPTPRRRGAWPVGPMWLERESPLGLWRRRESHEAPLAAYVAPDLRGPADDVLAWAPRRARRPAAVGSVASSGDLAGLRPFGAGDDPRHVDWKASARLGVTMAREWRPDRRASLLLAIDAGRAMRSLHDGESKLDAALRTAARVALLAETRGDRVGACVFARQARRLVPSLSGPGQATRLLHALADIEPEAVESDLWQAVPHLASGARRSLVLVLTDVIDADGARALAAPARELSRRHVPVLVLVRDGTLDEALARPVLSEHDAYRRAAAELVLAERDAGIALLRAHGLAVVDASMRAVAARVAALVGELV